MTRARALYGQSPAHLLAVLAAFALAGAALIRFVDAGPLRSLALWFGGAIIAHDFILFPACALADRSARRVAPSAINYLRVPTVLSGLMLLVYFPLILGLSATRYRQVTGMDAGVYLGRWLALSGIAFATSALIYTTRRRRRRARAGSTPASNKTPTR